jgi:lipopolysaccharide/colanic/teichoic acid biosynthesis glycosyltransferase
VVALTLGELQSAPMKPLASTPLEFDASHDYGVTSSRLVTTPAGPHEAVRAQEEGRRTVIDLRDDRPGTIVDLRGEEHLRWTPRAPSLAEIREEGILFTRPYDRLKRLIDVVVAGLLLLLSVPLLAILLIAIKIVSPGPALFAHERAGRGGRVFRCFKLRTMVPDADRVLQDMLDRDPALREEFASKAKLTDDPRVYPLGRWLRRLSIDELPQLWNVLRGDMSIVGPRPLALRETDMYGSALWVVLVVRPGLTGIWQVSGRNDLPYDKRVALDVNYAKNHTFAKDLAIILRTAPVLVRPGRSGAY